MKIFHLLALADLLLCSSMEVFEREDFWEGKGVGLLFGSWNN